MQDKVTKIFLDRLIETVKTEGKLLWERPFNGMYPFNYFSMYEYTGINRWLLPPGEYITANQINTYNKEHKTSYKFQKGIRWYPVIFVKTDKTIISPAELPASLRSGYTGKDGYVGNDFFVWYIVEGGKLMKCRKVRRYYQVADRVYFADDLGNCLPSKTESGAVVMNYTEPDKLIGDYINEEGIHITSNSDGGYFDRLSDTINIPERNLFKSNERYYSTWFHEVAHSTGHSSRLNRVGVSRDSDKIQTEKELSTQNTRKYVYSKEECIAELACALLCNEAHIQREGITDDVYKNHVAYVQSWIKYFESNQDDIISVMSDAEKAYKYVLQRSTDSVDAGAEPIGG